MFKILIVDDEKKHREGFVRLLYGMYPEDMLLEADGGEQALEVMRLLECDIVITDIRMPKMDGLELLRQIRQKYPHTAVVILSGYGEFDYARDAIKQGISDYLLKPVDAGEVKKCLDALRAEVTERKERDEDRQTMEAQLKETADIYMEYLMRQFVKHADFDKKEKIREIFPMEHPGYFFLCEIVAGEEVGCLDLQEFRLALKAYIRAASSYSFETEQAGVFAVLVMDPQKGDRSWFEAMERQLSRVMPGCRFRFSVSGSHENMYLEAQAAYEEALTAHRCGFYELGPLCDYDWIRGRLDAEEVRFPDQAKLIAESIRQNDVLSAFQTIREAIEAVTRERLPEPSSLLRAVMLQLFQTSKILDPMMSDEMKQRTDACLMKIYQSETKSRLMQQVYGFLLELGKNIHFQKEIKGVDVLEHCRDYLNRHYMEEVTLESVAEKYYFNASYFSTIFKNYFGKSFSAYLTELRMKRAKELLTDTEEGCSRQSEQKLQGTAKYKIKDVAGMVGYRDANYFIRAFKKFYGYTPEEYRKLKAQS